MSPTARNRDCEDLQDHVVPPKLEENELQALYGDERDHTCSPGDGEDQMSGDCLAAESVNEFTYLAGSSPQLCSPSACGHSARTLLHREVLFSNEMYYSKLEELKTAHLKNIADLQRLYLNQLSSGQRDSETNDQTDSLQVAQSHRQNLDPNQRITDSDQSDASTDECVSEQEDEPEWENTHRSTQDHWPPPTYTPAQRKWCSILKSSSPRSPANQHQLARVEKERQGSIVTIPQPFRMTLREEERKLHRVKTRSEVELENERLRRELDELKECGRKFRAKPAPPSTHLPPWEIINTRNGQRQAAKEHADLQGYYGNSHQEKIRCLRPQDRLPSEQHISAKTSPRRCFGGKPSSGERIQEKKPSGRRLQDKSRPRHSSQRNVPPLPQKPFSFIERERKKKEKKLQEALNNLSPREERRVFKARPVPKSLYRRTSQDYQLYGAIGLQSRTQARFLISTAPPGGPEHSLREEEPIEEDGKEPSPGHRGWTEKKQIPRKADREGRRNAEKESEWSYIHPLQGASNDQEVLKSEYISV